MPAPAAEAEDAAQAKAGASDVECPQSRSSGSRQCPTGRISKAPARKSDAGHRQCAPVQTGLGAQAQAREWVLAGARDSGPAEAKGSARAEAAKCASTMTRVSPPMSSTDLASTETRQCGPAETRECARE